MRRVALLAVLLCLLIVVPIPSAVAATAGAVFSCNFTGQTGNVDPIVSPGTTSEHPHIFYGAHPVDTVETSADLRSKPTTCVVAGNHSAYWMPELREDGNVVPPATKHHLLIYYRCRHDAATCSHIGAFPEDFGVVEGNVHATTAADNPAFRQSLGGYRCGTGGGTFSPTPPTTCASGILVVSITFGNCLFPDGTESDLVSSKCSAIGTPIVRLQMYFRFAIGAGAVGQLTIGGHDPVTLHADYFFGWDTATFQTFLDRCIHAGVNCGTNPSL